MPDGSTPVAQAKSTEQQSRWLSEAICQLEMADSIVSVGAKALYEQNCDIDSSVAHTLEEVAWPALHKATRAVLFALKHIDASKVPEHWALALATHYDDHERSIHRANEVSNG